MKIVLEPGEKLEVSVTYSPSQSYVVSYDGVDLTILAKHEPLRMDAFPRAEEVLARAARVAGVGSRQRFEGQEWSSEFDH